MKIMFLTSGGDIGGAKTHILSLADKLRTRHDVCLVSFRKGDFPNSASALGINVRIIANINFLKDISDLIKLYDEFKPDIVHCHGSKANTMGAILKIFRKIVTVTTLHSDYKKDYMHSKLKQFVFGGINSLALRKMDNFITVSNSLAESMIERGFNPLKIYGICNGLSFDNADENINKTEYLRSLGLNCSENDVIVGFAARLTAIKDASTLLKGFAKAHSECSNLKLIIAGDGEEREHLQNLTEKLDISEHVCFAGWLPDMSKFFSAVDICALTSLSEGFPYSIVEGARAKCAVVSTDVGGISGLISHGKTGFLFSPTDYIRFSELLIKLAQNPELRESFGEAVYQKARAEFSLDRMCDIQCSIYDSIIEKSTLSQKRNTVIICGAYGRGNIGDDAILHAIITEIRSLNKNTDIVIMTRNPKEAKLTERVDAIHMFDIFSFIKKLKHTKLFINGGGSLIQNATSSRSLYYYLFTIKTAKILGSNVMMYGCGIGPIDGGFNRKLTASYINKYVDVITLRDLMSRRELNSISANKPEILLSADPAISLSSSSPFVIDEAFRQENIPLDGKYLCLCLRSWKQYDFSSDIAVTAEYAYKKYGLTAVFIQAEYQKDLDISIQVAQKMSTPYYIVRKRYPAQTIIGMISRMDAVLSMRLHGLIFAAAQGIPTIGISYDVKIDGFMQYIRNPNFCHISEISSGKLISLTDNAIKNKNHAPTLRSKLSDKELYNIRTAKKYISNKG